MFERYTERARRVIFFARYEASQFGSVAIEPEHLLFGVLREDRDGDSGAVDCSLLSFVAAFAAGSFANAAAVRTVVRDFFTVPGVATGAGKLRLQTRQSSGVPAAMVAAKLRVEPQCGQAR